MEVIENRQDELLFMDLDCGTVFSYDGMLYLKTVQADISNHYEYAVSLSDGFGLENIPDDAVCRIYHSKIIVD